MGKKKADVLDAQRETFMKGAAARGIDAKLATEIFNLMAHFADYGFNKSHSAAYALVAYQTAYLKANFPQEFMAALLTSVMGTNDKIGFYIEECRRMGLAVLPPDINASSAGFTVDGAAIRFGLAGVKNVGENAIANIAAARSEGGRFTSLVDFCSRVDMRVVNKRVIESLIKCGAFDSSGWRRSQLLAVLEQAVEVAACRQRDLASGQIGLFGDETCGDADEIAPPNLDELPRDQLLAMEKEMTGFYVTGHPLDQFREKLKQFTPVGQLSEGGYSDGQQVKIAGMVASAKRITTKSGGMMCFVGLEDFTGQVEVVVFPRIFDKTSRQLLIDAPLAVSGRLNISDETVKVIADDIIPLDAAREVRLKLRDHQETPQTFSRLKQVFERYHGSAAVYLHFIDNQRVVKTDPEFWLDPTPDALQALEKILGKDAVKVG
jgi:DNA polymerase III subunit alpha